MTEQIVSGLIILVVVIGAAVGAVFLANLILFPWMLLLHVFSLGWFPAPEFWYPFKRKKP